MVKKVGNSQALIDSPAQDSNFVPQPFNENQTTALAKIKEVTHLIIVDWFKANIASTHLDGPTLIEKYVALPPPSLEEINNRATQFFHTVMETIYPIFPDHPSHEKFKPSFQEKFGPMYAMFTRIYGQMTPMLVQRTGVNDIQNKILDVVAAPHLKELAASFEEKGYLDIILSPAPQNL
jgi:hypothetical protein